MADTLDTLEMRLDQQALDDGYEVFCWVGLDADLAERKTAMNKCAEYLERLAARTPFG